MTAIKTKCIEINSKDEYNNTISTMCVCVSGISHKHNLCESVMDLNLDGDTSKQDIKNAIIEQLPEVIEKIVE